MDHHGRDSRPPILWPGKTTRWGATILLAELVNADIILLDEKVARHVARQRGLTVTGLLGVLGDAASRGLVELAPAIDRLRKTSFRHSPALLRETLDRFGRGSI